MELGRWRSGERVAESEWVNLTEGAAMAMSESEYSFLYLWFKCDDQYCIENNGIRSNDKYFETCELTKTCQTRRIINALKTSWSGTPSNGLFETHIIHKTELDYSSLRRLFDPTHGAFDDRSGTANAHLSHRAYYRRGEEKVRTFIWSIILSRKYQSQVYVSSIV